MYPAAASAVVHKKKKRGTSHKIALPFLTTLKSVRPAQRTIMLSHLDNPSCEIVCQAIGNALHNTVISPVERTDLKNSCAQYKTLLRYLSRPSGSIEWKKKKLPQLGGQPLEMILSSVIPLLMRRLTKQK